MRKVALCVKIDGIDGAGKSTLVGALADVYNTRLSVAVTKEFGNWRFGTAIPEAFSKASELLYELSLNPHFQFDTIEREIAMALSSRRQNRLVLPRLVADHDLVISDRSSLANYAYAYELGVEFHRFLDSFLLPVLTEDWVLWMDTDPRVAFARHVRSADSLLGGHDQDTVEQRGIDYQIGVRTEFGRLAANRGNVLVLDGSLSKADVLRTAVEKLDALLGCR